MISKKILHSVNICMLALAAALLLSGCMTSKKLDRFVSQQYGGELPRLVHTRNDNISVTLAVADDPQGLSHTIVMTKHLVPLLFYWQFDYIHQCTLNPGIFTNKFTNTVALEARKWLEPKLGDEKLALTIEQLPHAFAIDDKGHMIWIILYAFGWDNVNIKPQTDNLLVAYKLLKGDQVIKSGEISVPDEQSKERITMFRSWKSAASEFISRYNYEIASMSKTCMEQLAKQL